MKGMLKARERGIGTQLSSSVSHTARLGSWTTLDDLSPNIWQNRALPLVNDYSSFQASCVVFLSQTRFPLVRYGTNPEDKQESALVLSQNVQGECKKSVQQDWAEPQQDGRAPIPAHHLPTNKKK